MELSVHSDAMISGLGDFCKWDFEADTKRQPDSGQDVRYLVEKLVQNGVGDLKNQRRWCNFG
jgi:hypothetical protein